MWLHFCDWLSKLPVLPNKITEVITYIRKVRALKEFCFVTRRPSVTRKNVNASLEILISLSPLPSASPLLGTFGAAALFWSWWLRQRAS